VLEDTVARHGDRPAHAWRTDDGWITASWREVQGSILRAAAGFVELGVAAGDGVAILSANRPEWAIADLAAIAAGAIPTGLFTTAAPEQWAYILGHSGASVVVVDGEEAWERLSTVRGRLPGLRAVVRLDDVEDPAQGIVGWSALLERGERAGFDAIAARLAAQHPGDVATLIYTSGTTGEPKGVELTHANLVWMAAQGTPVAHRLGERERQLSYLPLAHIAEQMLTLHLPIRSGSLVHFVERMEDLPRALTEVRPTHFFGVPRVWEKVAAALAERFAAAPRAARALAGAAMRAGRAGAKAREAGRRPGPLSRLADRVVLSKVRARLGFDQAGLCGSAAAPISKKTLWTFQSLGIPLVEVYGSSETTGLLTLSTPERFRIGAVGEAVPGVELRIAEDGEIVARGPNIFRGYRDDPEATRAVIDEEGWFSTGDVGELDDEGFLSITGRKKELLVTSGGKKVAPSAIESRLRGIAGVAHAMLLGERRHFVAALLTLDPGRLPALTARAGSAARDLAAAAVCPHLRAHLEREVKRVNRSLARFESVRRFELLAGEFSIEGGELTPTLKLRRNVIETKYAAEIERIYSGSGAEAPAR